MSYYSLYRQYFMFYEVWRSNVQECSQRSKGCLQTTLCVLACFVQFYVFVLNEIHVRGHKIVYKYIRVGNVQVKLPKDHPRVLDKGPFP